MRIYASAKGVILLLAWLLAVQSQAKVVGLFDLDGTVFNDRGETAAWITPWMLRRIDQMHSMFQQPTNRPVQVELSTPEQVEYYNARYSKNLDPLQVQRVSLDMSDTIAISYHDYYKFQSEWAKSDVIAGGLKPVLLGFDPLFPDKKRLVVPGYYHLYDTTYKYYRERRGPARDSYIVKDYRAARERTEKLGAPYTWKGPAFELYRAMMSNASSVLNVVRFTSRGHRADDYYELDDSMVNDGEIKHAKGANGERPIVHSFSQPDARIYGQSLVEKKVQVVRGTAEALFRTSGTPHLELNPDPRRAELGEMVRLHTMIVAEDEVSYVSAISDYMANLSGDYFADKIKLVLFNSGTDEEVKGARFPWRWTVFHNRQGRPATEAEIQNWLSQGSCEQQLGGK